MQQILDLHIHSKYSRACSPQLTLENIDAACRVKGVDIIATGDFTFPDWFSEIKNKLEEIPPTPFAKGGNKSGLYKLKSAKDDRVKFILSTEVALIYKDGGKARRIHLVIHAPSLAAVEELNKYLDKNYNIRSDGRPILGLAAPDLMKLCLGIDEKFLIYPAHIWTPWFSVFGSKSGFDKMEECFHEYTKNIYAIETGLSSDPEMNWRLSALDKFAILSNSDAHSLPNIAREANVFEMKEVSYDEIYNIIKNKKIYYDNNEMDCSSVPISALKKKTGCLRGNDNAGVGIKYTIEFYPEEGMYHYDGHRACGLSFTPEQTKKLKGICPACKKPLTIGVMNRVDELAGRPVNFKPESAAPFKKIVELDKIIAEVLDIKSRRSKNVQSAYDNLIKLGGNELNILLNISLKDLEKITDPAIVEGIKRVREGNLIIKPGFDGQYGIVKIFDEQEKKKNKQRSLF
ncbi:MAG: endonuclease Q family protein [Patescibacteria group bacterium]|nr:endonuclease Q family protein [Patescibacteria group bacterium]